MNEESELKKIEFPKKEIDKPPSSDEMESKGIYSKLPPSEQRDLFKWLKNFNFLYFVIILMFIVFGLDLLLAWFKPEAKLTLQEPLFDTLKILLFTVSGFVFAKAKDE